MPCARPSQLGLTEVKPQALGLLGRMVQEGEIEAEAGWARSKVPGEGCEATA